MPGVLLLITTGIGVSGIQGVSLTIFLWVLALLWLVLNIAPVTRDKVPRFVVRPSISRAQSNSSERSRALRSGLREVSPGDYQGALRQVVRLLYVNEGLYSQASGGGDMSDSGIWVAPAPKDTFGDPLYRQLGLPPEDAYC
jgi:hypothetical protein